MLLNRKPHSIILICGTKALIINLIELDPIRGNNKAGKWVVHIVTS